MGWHADIRRKGGGRWVCRIKNREYKRAHYEKIRDKERQRNHLNWCKRARNQNFQYRGHSWCFHRNLVDRVIRLVEPKGLGPTEIAQAMKIDERNGSNFLAREWVSEEKLDRFLVGFGCEHLWHFPPLDEYYQLLLEVA